MILSIITFIALVVLGTVVVKRMEEQRSEINELKKRVSRLDSFPVENIDRVTIEQVDEARKRAGL